MPPCVPSVILLPCFLTNSLTADEAIVALIVVILSESVTSIGSLKLVN